MPLEFLDPSICKQILSGTTDILSPQAESDETFYANISCPTCHGHCRRITHSPASDGPVQPTIIMQCLACGCQFDPKTGILVKLGNLAQALKPAIPILKPRPESK